MTQIVTELPRGYRWATAEETERATATGDYVGMVQVVVGGTEDDPWTDLAIAENGAEGP